MMLYIVVLLFGAVIGSFLNVCIHRLPREESVAWPASHCPSCGQPIAAYDNIPVISYLMLRGRCRACRAPISIRYPLVEAVNAIAYGIVFWMFGFTATACIYAALISALIVVTGTDVSHYMIPDTVTLPGIVIGLLGAVLILPVGIVDSLLGVLVGGGSLWFLAWVSPYIFGKEGMGGGDIKLMAMVGSFIGWQPALLAIMIGSLLGSVIGGGLMAARVMRREQYIPFGPFLAIGSVLALLFHQPLFEWYWSLIDLPQ
ncbi:MAG: Leader peptidase (Prepilin peptidase) / N-methyltransferase [Nitrospira sp.]|jgi:leader peptidase (prepilin peptidase)/N-methyltransferase|nr:MAG: Leader peptidase (Prepilin peptidase) / N-methyltransferase [Nitrospira sp.]